MQRRLLSILVAIALVGFLAATGAWAARPHFVVEPVCTLEGQVIECVGGAVAGLGNEPVTAFLEGEVACETKSGANQPGGHIQTRTDPLRVRSGKVTFNVTTPAADCPRGLNPVVGNTAIITVREFPSGDVLATFRVPIT